MDYVIDSTTEKLHSTGGIALAGKIWERIQLGTDEMGKTLKHPHSGEFRTTLRTRSRDATVVPGADDQPEGNGPAGGGGGEPSVSAANSANSGTGQRRKVPTVRYRHDVIGQL